MPYLNHQAMYLGVAMLLLLPQANAAEKINIKAGLWDMQMQNSLNGKALPDVVQMMAKMPPEARQTMQNAMRQDNSSVRFGANGNMQHCLTAEQIAKNDLMAQDPKNPCAITVLNQSKTLLKISIDCKQPKANGIVETTVQNGESYTSVSDLNMIQGGQSMRLQSTVKGKWLGADCGSGVTAKGLR